MCEWPSHNVSKKVEAERLHTTMFKYMEDNIDFDAIKRKFKEKPGNDRRKTKQTDWHQENIGKLQILWYCTLAKTVPSIQQMMQWL